jgi:hypothetical protein
MDADITDQPRDTFFWVVGLIIALMMAVRTSETSVNLYQSTRRYITESAIFVHTAVRTSNHTK